jgi:DNA-directed RNA polymerase subunit RPC12/RpoP
MSNFGGNAYDQWRTECDNDSDTPEEHGLTECSHCEKTFSFEEPENNQLDSFGDSHLVCPYCNTTQEDK